MLGAGTGLSRGLWAQASARTTTLLCQEDPGSRDPGAEIPGTGSLELGSMEWVYQRVGIKEMGWEEGS